MKTTLLGLLIMCSFALYITQNKSKDIVEETKPTTNAPVQETKSPRNETFTISTENHETLNETSTIVDLEKSFHGLTERELEAKIEMNNKMAKDLNLFQLANSEKLDSRLSKIIVEYIRVNRVLNQILLDKRIEELEKAVL